MEHIFKDISLMEKQLGQDYTYIQMVHIIVESLLREIFKEKVNFIINTME
jgi:hypothetical protein